MASCIEGKSQHRAVKDLGMGSTRKVLAARSIRICWVPKSLLMPEYKVSSPGKLFAKAVISNFPASIFRLDKTLAHNKRELATNQYDPEWV
jgi:hypothetical protein